MGVHRGKQAGVKFPVLGKQDAAFCRLDDTADRDLCVSRYHRQGLGCLHTFLGIFFSAGEALLASVALQTGKGLEYSEMQHFFAGSRQKHLILTFFMMVFQQTDKLEAKFSCKRRKKPFHTQNGKPGGCPGPQGCCWGSIISLGATTILAQEEGWQTVHFSDVDLGPPSGMVVSTTPGPRPPPSPSRGLRVFLRSVVTKGGGCHMQQTP